MSIAGARAALLAEKAQVQNFINEVEESGLEEQLRAADSAQVELHKQEAQDWKEAHTKSETARHEIFSQNSYWRAS